MPEKSIPAVKIQIVIIGKIADKDAQRTIDLLLETGAITYHKNTYLTEQEKIYLIQKSAALLFLSNLRSEAFGIVQLEPEYLGLV